MAPPCRSSPAGSAVPCTGRRAGPTVRATAPAAATRATVRAPPRATTPAAGVRCARARLLPHLSLELREQSVGFGLPCRPTARAAQRVDLLGHRRSIVEHR